MNKGLILFKRKRLQGGTQKVEENTDPVPPWLQAGYQPNGSGTDEWVSPSGRKYVASAKEASGLYSPTPMSERDIAQAELESELADNASLKDQPAEWKPDSYKTVGVNIEGKEVEIPQWGGQTVNEAEEAARMRLEWNLDPFVDDSVLEKAQNDAHQGPDDASALGHQRGTSNIMGMQTTANPGMKLFMAKIKGTRPKLLVPHPSRARLPNAAQLAQSVETPIGVKKGSSGIHIKPSHKGLFTAKAKSAGMGVQGYASKVLSGGSGASAATRRQANFARNAAKWNH